MSTDFCKIRICQMHHAAIEMGYVKPKPNGDDEHKPVVVRPILRRRSAAVVHHGQVIQEIRRQLRISQRELGRRLGITGQAVSKAEKQPTLGVDKLHSYAEALAVHPRLLMSGTQSEGETEPPGAWAVLVAAANALGDDGTVADLLNLLRSLAPSLRGQVLAFAKGLKEGG